MLKPPHEIVLTLPGFPLPGLTVAACRAGALGVLDLEYERETERALANLAALEQHAAGAYGVKLDADAGGFLEALLPRLPGGVRYAVLTGSRPDAIGAAARRLSGRGIPVLIEVRSLDDLSVAADAGAEGVIAKGLEAGGRVGTEPTFILLQRILSALGDDRNVRVWAQGGIGPDTAAAVAASGADGVVLDWQLALTREASGPGGLPSALRERIRGMDGSETICLGEDLGEGTRVFARPGMEWLEKLQSLEKRLLVDAGEAGARESFRAAVLEALGQDRPDRRALLMGQDGAFAGTLGARFRTVGGVLQGIRRAIDSNLAAARRLRPLDRDAPLARSHQTAYPVLQGPMTRVSDVAPFAEAVAQGGALPFLALALMRGPAVKRLLEETRQQLGARPWGVGILGFVPLELRKEQLEAIEEVRPPFALIAGGRPDQARRLEERGITTYLHVPSPGLLEMFLRDGARRFVFEGRECGGHVGPRSSFVLWQTMIDILLREVPPDEFESIHVAFAGGIHDALSASMVAALAAPLAARGVKIGVLLGTAYLFTREAVAAGAIQRGFQEEAVRCSRTVLLESGPGHATRCADTNYAREFRELRLRLIKEGRAPDEIREHLERLNLGRLRIASKGIAHESGGNGSAGSPRYRQAGEDEQREHGMFMIGQVAVMRGEVTTVQALHEEVSTDAMARLDALDRPAEIPSLAAAVEKPSNIAIVGIGCFLPKALDPVTYWDNILGKTDAIIEVPPDRWDWRQYFDADRSARDKVYSRWGGFLDEVPFDPFRYGMPPASLDSIEPLQLLTLEVSRAALEDAGYANREFDRERVSVIFGAGGGAADLGAQYCMRAHLPMIYPDAPPSVYDSLPEWTEDSFAGILLNVAAGRVANRLDLGGVNFTVDAACAASLASLYLAARELEVGQSDMVIVGGADTLQNPFAYMCFAKTQALSPRGRCRTFDAGADGIAISEGVAAVVLKRLEDAERDGDHIYAVIKGVGGSSDGRDRGLTAPRPEGQVRALERAYAKAGFSPATVGLFEAHGTGTVAGDEAEAKSLRRVLEANGAEPASAAVGSVKSMIGHTKCTAGIAGLIKVALALHEKVLPPTLNVEQPNPKAGFKDGPLYVNSEARPWIQTPGHPRRAGVSAFGFGGTNFHAVLEEYDRAPLVETRASRRWPAELFTWSGGDRRAILDRIRTLHGALAAGAAPAMGDLAMGLAASRPESGNASGRLNLAIVAESIADLQAKLARCIESLEDGAPASIHDPRGIYFTEAPLGWDGRVAFLFPGQGSQYPGMMRQLALEFGEVREAFERADAILAGKLPKPLSRYVFPPPSFTAEEAAAAKEALTDTRVAQPALGAAGVAAFSLLQRLGIAPEMVAGHSYGEYVALRAADRIDEETLLLLSEARGRAIVEAADDDLGAMAAVQAPAGQVESIFRDDDGVTIANRNAPRQTIISGARAAIEAAVARLAGEGLDATPIPVACAFHSPLMAPARDRLEAALGGIRISEGKCAVYSNTLGGPYPAAAADALALLSDHLVQPVRFMDEIQAMHDDGARIFVEAGPGGVLTGLARQSLEGREFLAVALDNPRRDGRVQLLHALGQLLSQGVSVNLAPLFEARPLRAVDPSRLAQAEPERAQTRWVVSGHRVRRISAGQPAPSAPRPPAAPKSAAAARPSAPPPPPPPTSSPRTPVPPDGNGRKREKPPMRKPNSDRVDVMQQYHDLMQAFLDTQKSVMLAFLRGAGAGAADQETVSSVLETELAESPARPAIAAIAGAREPAAPEPAAPEPDVQAPPAHHDAPPAPSPESARPRAAAKLGLDELVDRLVLITSERTGYPPDMLDLDSDLEADLGIDSIKRVEILGTLQTWDRVAGWKADEDLMERLREIKTLRGIAHLLFEVLGGQPPSGGPDPADPPSPAPSAPSDGDRAERTSGPNGGGYAPPGAPRNDASAPGAREPAVSPDALPEASPEDFEDAAPEGPPPEAAPRPREEEVARYTLHAVESAPEGTEARALTPPSGVLLITDDDSGIARALEARLAAVGARAVVIPSEDLGDPESIEAAVAGIRREHGPLGGIIHAAPLGACDPPEAMALDRYRALQQRETKAFFHLLRVAAADLKNAGGGAWAVAPTLGADDLPHRGAMKGLMRSLSQEWPGVRCRAVDFDAPLAPELAADRILQEASSESADLVSLWRGDRRFVLRPRLARCEGRELSIDGDAVILITGGARGITASIGRKIAERYKPTLVILGRSPRNAGSEPADIAGAHGIAAIRAALLARAREAGRRPTPRQIEDEIARIMAGRELEENLSAMEQSGARVVYRSVDVRDEAALGAALDETYARFGKIDGVIHGAGIIEDKRLEEKSPASFDRVFDTKVDSIHLLARHLRAQDLRFVALFSSVAGVFGNSGQVDYAAANEVLNHYAARLDAAWPCRVVAVNWGPWDQVGMASEEIKRRFRERGVQVLPVDAACEAFLEEITTERRDEPIVVLGDGPWRHIATGEELEPTPLLRGISLKEGAGGSSECVRVLDPRVDRYLRHHKLDGKPVLPAAAALAFMAEAARKAWPDLQVVGARDLRVLRGIALQDSTLPVRIAVRAASHAPVEPEDLFLVAAELTEPGQPARPYYAATICLAPARLPAPTGRHEMPGPLAPYPLPVGEAYRKWLFHGPTFQCVRRIEGVSEAAIVAEIHPSRPADCLSAGRADRWVVDPVLVDGCLQLALLWVRAVHGVTGLPSRMGRVRVYDVDPETPLSCSLRVREGAGSAMVRSDILCLDPSGRVAFAIDGFEFTCSSALNRLVGWSGEVLGETEQVQR